MFTRLKLKFLLKLFLYFRNSFNFALSKKNPKQMQKIDLSIVIEKGGFPKKEISKLLFPAHKHPMLALGNVLKGELKLDSDQISKLSEFTGIPIDHLFEVAKWQMQSSPNQIELNNGDFRALLNTETWVTKIFCKGSLFHESVIHNGSTPLSEYVNQIETLISKHKENEQN